MTVEIGQTFSGKSSEGALFTISAISEHLRILGYPENSISSMLKCGCETGQEIIAHCGSCGDTKLIPLVHHCNLRICPSCSQIRQKRIKKRYLPIISSFSVSRGSLNSLYFLTISPENYSSLDEGLKHIRASWKKFLRTKYIKERVKGGIWVIETKNTGKGWHIHIHALFYGRRLDNSIRGNCLDCGQNYIKFDKKTEKYFCASRKCFSQNVVYKTDSKIVEIWKSCSSRNVMFNVQELKSAIGGLNYVLKYISSLKEEFNSVQDVATYVHGIRKQKLINVFGVFFKFKFVKPVCFCRKCGGILDFTFDLEISTWIKKERERVRGEPLTLFNG